MDKPDISVIIPTARKTGALESCLDTLSRQSVLNFEVIIVTADIESAARIKEKFKELNLVLVQEKEKKGLVAARNLGLASSRGRIISFIDDDVTVSRDWIKEVLNTFDRSEDVGGVSGPTLIPRELLQYRDILAFHDRIKKNIFWKLISSIYIHIVLENRPYSIGKIFKSGAFSLGANYAGSVNLNNDIEVDYLEACNMSFRKDILDKMGGFSREYGGVGDWSEPDLAFRVKKEGCRLMFNPKAIVNHCISRQRVYGEKGGDSYQRAKNFIRFYFKWIKPDNPDKAIRFIFNLIYINLYWVYKSIQTKNANWLLGIRGMFSGLRSQLCRL